MNEVQVAVSGVSTHWTLRPVPREKLWRVLERHGYQAAMPPETTDRVALKAALEDVKGKGQIVKPLEKAKDNGYAVATIVKGTVQNDYPHDYAAKVVDNGWVEIVNGNPHRQLIQEQFGVQKRLVPAGALTTALQAVLKALGSVVLYPGTYWIPPDGVSQWELLTHDIEHITDRHPASNKFWLVTTQMDARTLTEVRDALMVEIKGTLKTITSDVEAGELKDEALLNRLKQAQGLHGRIKEYEDILDAALDDIHETVEEVQRSIMLGQMQGMGV